MLPTGKYQFISSHYTSVIDGGGTICENCGRLIANIVIVKLELGKCYTIGADCAETLFGKSEIQQAKSEIKLSKRKAEMKIKEICREISKLYGKSCIFNKQDGIDLYNIAKERFEFYNIPLPKEYSQYKS